MTAHANDLTAIVAAAGAAVKAYPNGRVIFVKDGAADFAYVIKAGAVEIREGGRVLEAIGVGEIFGELGVIDGGPRSASAVAVGDTELYALDRTTFDRLVSDNHDFVVALMHDMARRLRATNERHRRRKGLPVESLPPVA